MPPATVVGHGPLHLTFIDSFVGYFDKGRSCLKNLDSYMVNLRSELANVSRTDRARVSQFQLVMFQYDKEV